MKIGIGRPMAEPKGGVIPDVDMGLVGKAAEDLGFDWISYGHHTVRPLDEPIRGPHTGGVPMYQDIVVGFARATALTQRLEVASGVAIIPMLHPVVFGKAVASLDLYSGGRVLLGVGVGGASQIEIETSGGVWNKRWAYTAEMIKVMKGLWTSDRFEFEGEYFNIPPVLMNPKPFRRGGPKILLGSSLSDVMMARMMDFGDGWMPAMLGGEGIAAAPARLREGRARISQWAAEAGRDPAQFEIAAIVLGDMTRDDIARFRDASCDRVAVMLPNISSIEDARREMGRIAEAVL